MKAGGAEGAGDGKALDLVVTEEQLACLAGQVSEAFSELSPFRILRKRYGEDSGNGGLPGAFVDGTGRLRPEAVRALGTLAAARSFGSISFAGRGLVFESAAYFREDDPAGGVSLANRGDELRVQSPPATAAVLELLSLQTGESLLRRIDLEIGLSRAEGAVFFGCLDAVRRKELARILDGKVGGGYRVSHVEEALAAAEVGMQWLAPLYLRFSPDVVLDGRIVRESLTALLNKGIVKKDQGGWKPSPLLRQAAAELLLIDGHARLRRVSGGHGTATVSDLRVVQGRSGAFLVWTGDPSSVSITGASAAQVVIIARGVMAPPGCGS